MFGAQDGLLTTLGIVTGVGGATGDRPTIILTGLISLFVGALSMGAGQYLGVKAEREVVEYWLEHERRELTERYDDEVAEQICLLPAQGLHRRGSPDDRRPLDAQSRDLAARDGPR